MKYCLLIKKKKKPLIHAVARTDLKFKTKGKKPTTRDLMTW